MCVAVCRRVSVLGKHTRSISCGAWNGQNLLALGADDHLLTVSNSDGDTLYQFTVRGSPSNVQFSALKSDERHSATDDTVSSQYVLLLCCNYSVLSFIHSCSALSVVYCMISG